MSSIGPALPTHLMPKRERDEDETKVIGPSVPGHSRSPSSDRGAKRARVMGPSLPPAILNKMPATDPEVGEVSESDDDDLGPAPPPIPGTADHAAELKRSRDFEASLLAEETTKKPQREEWMLAPPISGDWSSKVDPTKLKSRKFTSGKGAKAPQGSSKNTALWTETPEQKRKRVEDEVMGIRRPAQLDPDSKKSAKNDAESRETDRRIQEYNDRNRNFSLFSEHKKTNPQEKEDDPSKRAFDREKDMGVGVKIGHAKRKELLTKAADFGSRFAKGNYL